MKELSIEDTAEAKRKMRVRIAKDVLELLKQRKFIVSPGIYLDTKMIVPKSWLKKATQVGKKLLTKPCTVCAMGALFVAEVVRNDKLNFAQLNNSNFIEEGRPLTVGRAVMDDRLRRFFTERDLQDIEGYFEGWGYQDRTVNFWIKSYPDARQRLRAIMRNIIRNEGDFKPKLQRNFLKELFIRRMRALGMGSLLKSKTVRTRKKSAVKGHS